MKRILSILVFCFLVLALRGQSVIGGSGFCAVTENPNNVTAIQDQDDRTECVFAVDTASNILYQYFDDSIAGKKWQVVQTKDNQELTLLGTLLSIDRGNTVDLSALDTKLTQEEVEDMVNAVIQTGSNGLIVKSYDDANDSITLSVLDRTLMLSGSDLSILGGNTVDLSGLGGGANELSDLSDVNTSTPTNRNFLIADGTDWESRAAEAADIQSGTFADGRISQTSVTQHEGAIDHDALLNYSANQHRIINDAGVSLTELWSSSKINTELSGKAASSHTHDASDVISGQFADGRISASSVLQHETDDQDLSISGNILSIENDPTGDVDLSPYLDNTDGQTLSFSNPNITITGGNSVDISGIDTQLSIEEVQDNVGVMVAGNIETGIDVTYNDAANRFDFVVDDASATNEIQDLGWNATGITISDGGAGISDANVASLLDDVVTANEGRAYTIVNDIITEGAGITFAPTTNGDPELDHAIQIIADVTQGALNDTAANIRADFPAGGGSPGGSNTEIQYNDGGSFNGDVDFTFDKTTNDVRLNGDFDLEGNIGIGYYNPNASYSIMADNDARFYNGTSPTDYVNLDAGNAIEIVNAGVGLKWSNTAGSVAMQIAGSSRLTATTTLITALQDFQVNGEFGSGVAPVAGIQQYIKSAGNTEGTTAFLLRNSDDDDLLRIKATGTPTGLVMNNIHGTVANTVQESGQSGVYVQNPLTNNVLFDAVDRMKVTATNTSNSNYYRWFNNEYAVGGCDINASATAVIGIGLARKSALTSITYPKGKILIYVYTGTTLGACTGKWISTSAAETSLTWNGLVATDNAQKIYEFEITSNSPNYLDSLQLTIVNSLGTPAQVMSIEYYPERKETTPVPIFSKYKDEQLYNTMSFRNNDGETMIEFNPNVSDVITTMGDVKFGLDYTLHWDHSTGRLEIGGEDPTYTLHVNSTQSDVVRAVTSNSVYNHDFGLTTDIWTNQITSVGWYIKHDAQTHILFHDNGNTNFGGTGTPTYKNTFGADAYFIAGIRDKDGELGTSGQFLSSTGTQVDWVNPPGGGTTEEEVEDWVGGMLGGTQTLITVSYDDPNGELDFVVDNNLANFDNSTSNFMVELLDDTTPELGGNIKLGENAQYETFTAGATVSAGDLCTMNSSLTDGEFVLADCDFENLSNSQLVIALESGTDGVATDFAVKGMITGLSGLTPNKPVWISATAGGLTTTKPSTTNQYARVVGYAHSATKMYLDPSKDWIKIK